MRDRAEYIKDSIEIDIFIYESLGLEGSRELQKEIDILAIRRDILGLLVAEYRVKGAIKHEQVLFCEGVS